MDARPGLFALVFETFSQAGDQFVPAVAHDEADAEEVVEGAEAGGGDVALEREGWVSLRWGVQWGM